MQLEFRRLIWESLKPDQHTKEKKKYKLGFKELEQPKPIKRPAPEELPIANPIKPKQQKQQAPDTEAIAPPNKPD